MLLKTKNTPLKITEVYFYEISKKGLTKERMFDIII